MPTVLLRVFARFASTHPGVNVSPETMPMRRAVEDVRAGRLDVAVLSLPAPVAELDVTPLDVEGTVAAIANRHPLSGQTSVELERLENERLLLLPRSTNPAFFDGIAGACRSAGIAPTLVETPEPDVMHALLSVAAGAGIALLPSSAAERYSAHGVSFRPLEQPSPTTEIALITRAGGNETMVSAFVRVARELPPSAKPLPATARPLHAVAAMQ
jgi:DNA-binding transcriptional LysR family regulator